MFGFGQKNQQKLDAAFLRAVGKHDFKKAKKILEKGANVLAQDAEGNTAFHRLTSAAEYRSEEEIYEFACFLQGKNLDIRAGNKQGQTCLHLVAEKMHYEDVFWPHLFKNGLYRCPGPKMASILLKRGARISDKDGSGRTLLHLEAAKGDRDMVAACLSTSSSQISDKDGSGRTVLHLAAANGDRDMAVACLSSAPSLIAVQDNEGKYPHQLVVAKSVKLEDFQQWLEKKLEKHQSPKVQEETAAPVADISDNNWILLKPNQVAYISVEKVIGYKLTEIFNFSARTYARITHNLETKADVSETRGFDEFPDKSAFAAARQELLRRGGQAEEGSVHGQVLDKKRPPLSKDA